MSKGQILSAGTTLVFTDQTGADRWEPYAPPLKERIDVLKGAHQMGIETWVSLEPVIDPEQTLELIRTFHPIVGQWNVERLNYRRPDKPVDWTGFREEVQMLLDSIGANYILK